MIIWTRDRHRWSHDQQLFGEDLADLLRLPCIRIEALPWLLPQKKPDFFVITSVTAVESIRGQQSLLSGCPCFTHGEKTARALFELGIRPEWIKDAKDGKQLVSAIGHRMPRGTSGLFLGAQSPAVDYEAFFKNLGIQLNSIATYRTVLQMTNAEGEAFSSQAISDMQKELSGVVCFASPSAVEGFNAALQPEKNRLSRALVAISIGPTTTSISRKTFAKTIESSHQTLQSLAETARIQWRTLPRKGRR